MEYTTTYTKRYFYSHDTELVTCPGCHGTGRFNDYPENPCGNCFGAGRVRVIVSPSRVDFKLVHKPPKSEDF